MFLDLILSHARFKGDAAGGRVQDSKVVRVRRREQVDVQELPGGRHGFDVGICPERPAYSAEGCRRPPAGCCGGCGCVVAGERHCITSHCHRPS